MNCDRYPPGVHYRDINLYRQRLQQKLASQPYTGGLRFNFVDVFESSPTASSVGGHNDQSGSDSTLDNRDSVSSLNSSQHAELVQQQSRTPSALSLANVDTDYTTSTTNTGHITDNNRDLSNSTQKAADDNDNKDQVDLHSIHQPNSSITSPWVELDINQGVVEENQEVQTQEQIEDKGNASKPATSSDDDNSALNAEQSVESSEHPSSHHECSEFGTFLVTESTASTCSAHSKGSNRSAKSNRSTKSTPAPQEYENQLNMHQTRTSVGDSGLLSFMLSGTITTSSTSATNCAATTTTGDEINPSHSVSKLRDVIFESAAQPQEPQMNVDQRVNTAPAVIQSEDQTRDMNVLASAASSDYLLLSTPFSHSTLMIQQQQTICTQQPLANHHPTPNDESSENNYSFDPISMTSGEFVESSVFHDSTGNPLFQAKLDPSVQFQSGYYPPDHPISTFTSSQNDQLPDSAPSPARQQPGGATQPEPVVVSDTKQENPNISNADDEVDGDDSDEYDLIDGSELLCDDLFGSTSSFLPS